MCPSCWEVRNRTVPETPRASRYTLPRAALALGIASLLPGCWYAQIAGFIVSGMALSKHYRTPGRERTQSIIGLALTAVGAVVTALIFMGVFLAKF